MMIIPSTILILFAFSLLACSSDNDKLGGGAVEGNTVEAEYKVEPVQIDSEKIVVGESAIDSHPKEFDNCEWYSILLNSPRETYFEFLTTLTHRSRARNGEAYSKHLQVDVNAESGSLVLSNSLFDQACP